MSASPQQSVTACQTCRARHLDCDGSKPVCRPCRDNHRSCVPGFNVRFRRSRKPEAADCGFHTLSGGRLLTFRRDQVWIRLPEKLDFIDETDSISSEYDNLSLLGEAEGNDGGVSSSGAPVEPSLDSLDRNRLLAFPSQNNHFIEADDRFEDVQAPSPLISLPVPVNDFSPPPDSVSSTFRPLSTLHEAVDIAEEPDQSIRVQDLLCHDPRWTLGDNGNTSSSIVESPDSPAPISPLYCEITHSPAESRKYALLLNHFKTVLGRTWFDVLDVGFTNEVLRLAPFCPVLLYSLLAVSAIHMSRVGDYDINEAERYHERCIELLLPMLNEKSAITDGALLASSVILRFYEEISAPIHGRDHAWHLLGGIAFVAAAQNDDSQQQWKELGNAAFWVHQRQDVHNAILHQRPPRTDLGRTGGMCNNNNNNNSTVRGGAISEEVWAKRVSCLTADVVAFCFGDESASAARYTELRAQLARWDACKPASFRPLYFREGDPSAGRFFPEICFALDACVVGLAYYHLSMLLMAVYDPTQPRIGARCVSARRKTQDHVLQHVRTLCGIALSNSVPPGRAVASLAISECGAWFTDPIEREQLVGVLRLVEDEDAWPCESTIECLQEQWRLAGI